MFMGEAPQNWIVVNLMHVASDLSHSLAIRVWTKYQVDDTCPQRCNS